MAENPEDLIVTDAELRRQLPALAEELKIGGVDGSVPIFVTLAEAQAWEAKNPGKTALTLEASEPPAPDTEAPTAGPLTVTTRSTEAVLEAAGAFDDTGVTGYAWSSNGGATWTTWTASNSYTFTGLSMDTDYVFRHKVRDRAGNEGIGSAVTKRTLSAPFAGAADPLTGVTGSIVGRVTPTGNLTWLQGKTQDFAYSQTAPTADGLGLVSGGAVVDIKTAGASIEFDVTDLGTTEARENASFWAAVATNGSTYPAIMASMSQEWDRTTRAPGVKVYFDNLQHKTSGTSANLNGLNGRWRFSYNLAEMWVERNGEIIVPKFPAPQLLTNTRLGIGGLVRCRISNVEVKPL